MKENWSAAEGHFDKKKEEKTSELDNNLVQRTKEMERREEEKARAEKAERDKPWSREKTILWAESLGKDKKWIDDTFQFHPDGTITVIGDVNIGGVLLNNDPLFEMKHTVFPRGIIEVKGSLYLDKLLYPEGLEFPEKVDGDLSLNGLKSAKGLKLPQTVGGYVALNGLKSAEGLILPKEVGGDVLLHGIENQKGLTFPEKVGGRTYVGGDVY